MINDLEYFAQLFLSLLKLGLAASLETFALVYISLLLVVSCLHLFAAELLICKLKQLFAISACDVRGSSLRLLSLINGVEKLVLGDLSLGLLISQSLLGLKQLLVKDLSKCLFLK